MIENLTNHKKYIGKAENIAIRWSDHKRLANYKTLTEYNYPLYKAFRKYGIDNFKFSVIEECNSEILSERERYWIAYYETFGPKGYNQTPGGDGCPKILHSKAIELYNSGKTVKEIADYFGVTELTTIEALHSHGLAYMSQEDRNKLQNPREVQQFDLEGNYLKTYYSAGEAARTLKGKNWNSNQILKACNEHTTAYNFLWKYSDDNTDISTIVKSVKAREAQRRENVGKATLKRCSKAVNQYTLEGKYFQSFPSAAAAGRSLGKTGAHIAEVCRGVWPTAYNYKWRYISPEYPEGADLNNEDN